MANVKNWDSIIGARMSEYDDETTLFLTFREPLIRTPAPFSRSGAARLLSNIIFLGQHRCSLGRSTAGLNEQHFYGLPVPPRMVLTKAFHIPLPILNGAAEL